MPQDRHLIGNATFALMGKSRIILVVTNDLSGDQRMHRIASTLHEGGYEVLLVGRERAHSFPLAERPYETKRLKLRNETGKAFYLEYNWRIFRFLLKQQADIFTSNDLDTLLGTWLAAKIRKKRLVYDTHEYFTEVPELVHRPATRRVWLWLEKALFPTLKTVYTVNQSLASIYSGLYKVPVHVIRNVPFPKPSSSLPRQEKTILYQGALNVGRGLELLLEAMRLLPEYRLWIVGRGDVETALRTQAEQLKISDRVDFKGFMAPSDLAKLTPRASLGVSLEEDLGMNYHYASPNKVYDYIQARVPVLVSDLPEMRRVVEDYQVGEIVPADRRTPAGLAGIIRSAMEDSLRYRRWREACERAAASLNWTLEKKRLLALYQNPKNPPLPFGDMVREDEPHMGASLSSKG